MFKKLLKAGITFTLLLGCYFGYVRAFGYLVDQLKAERPDEDIAIPIHSSRSKQYAQQLARLAFGANHWTVTGDQPFAYYNAERGFWIFALQEEEVPGYDGKRLHLYPFAMIWKSSDGKNIQMLTAESAILDLNQPIALSSKQNTEGLKVKHAHIERNVRIRDDRGTPLLLADDMNIGPMTYLDFDDATQQITTESHVVIVDPDQTIIGDGLVIQLRRPDPDGLPSSSSGGFGGVEYAILMKNHRVTLRDVGESGVFPGNNSSKKAAAPAKAVQVAASASASKAGAQGGKPQAPVEPVPLHIRGDGLMRIDLPPDGLPVAVGPPAPPAPTLVRFERNVVALHGRPDKQPNQLDCDTLRLTLIPGAPPSQADKDKAQKDQAEKDRAAARAGCSRIVRPVRDRAGGRGGCRRGRWRGPSGRREVRQPLRQPRPPEAPCHRPRGLAPAPRPGLQGAVQRAGPQSPDGQSARYDPVPRRQDPADLAGEGQLRAGGAGPGRGRRGRGPPRPVRRVAEARPEDQLGDACRHRLRDAVRPGQRHGPGRCPRLRTRPPRDPSRLQGTR